MKMKMVMANLPEERAVRTPYVVVYVDGESFHMTEPMIRQDAQVKAREMRNACRFARAMPKASAKGFCTKMDLMYSKLI